MGDPFREIKYCSHAGARYGEIRRREAPFTRPLRKRETAVGIAQIKGIELSVVFGGIPPNSEV